MKSQETLAELPTNKDGSVQKTGLVQMYLAQNPQDQSLSGRELAARVRNHFKGHPRCRGLQIFEADVHNARYAMRRDADRRDAATAALRSNGTHPRPEVTQTMNASKKPLTQNEKHDLVRDVLTHVPGLKNDVAVVQSVLRRHGVAVARYDVWNTKEWKEYQKEGCLGSGELEVKPESVTLLVPSASVNGESAHAPTKNGYRLVGAPKVEKLTKELAERFANMTPVSGDRPLWPKRLDVYREQVRQGRFHPPEWAFARCLEDRATYRVNGKHTSTLFSLMDAVPDMFVTIKEFECDTLRDVARLYHAFDAKEMMRSTRDIYTTFAQSIPGLDKIPPPTISAIVTGIVFHRMEHRYEVYKMRPQERAAFLEYHADFVRWLLALLDKAEFATKPYTRLGTVAAMMATWEKDAEDALKFWLAVMNETNPDPHSVEQSLDRLVKEFRVSGTSHAKNERRSPVVLYAHCLRHWNAWRLGEKTVRRARSNSDVPIVV